MKWKKLESNLVKALDTLFLFSLQGACYLIDLYLPIAWFLFVRQSFFHKQLTVQGGLASYTPVKKILVRMIFT